MQQPDGFLKIKRQTPKARGVKERVRDYKEIYPALNSEMAKVQSERCMDCGVPFCHHGCPLGNNIPHFNNAVSDGDWERALHILESTNNFPEFTGRICPAPCEASCVLNINSQPVTIEQIEKAIAETAFERGYIKPCPPSHRTGKKIAVVGSGPAGLAAAAQLNQAGHWITVFERSDRIGGLLRYGIPDFKLEKEVLDRRLHILEQEGIIFRVNANVGVNVNVDQLKEEYDALILCAGASAPRDLPLPGRGLKGIHFAMDFLTQQNKRVAGDKVFPSEISSKGKDVLVIGGGDTGSDCVGTAIRQGAYRVTQIELLAKPPLVRDNDLNPWPQWPMVFTTTSSHEEGAERKWAVLTKEFVGDNAGRLVGIKVVDVQWDITGQRKNFKEIPGSERIIPCDLALLSIGFTGAEKILPGQLELDFDSRGNILSNRYKTVKDSIFVAGDMRRGQSLVVWAIAEGRECARQVDEWLMGISHLAAADTSALLIEKGTTASH